MSIWEDLGKVLFGLLANKANGQDEVSVEIPIGVPSEAVKPDEPGIDWTDPSAKISKHFTVKEALWLPSWQVMHIPSEEEKSNILEQAKKMDMVRDFLSVGLNVHCWLRPVLNNPTSLHHGQDYNAFVKGAKNSAHKIGKATDYDAQGLNCDNVRAELEPKLEEFGIRMERLDHSNWVHNDCAPVIAKRYFVP
jgi:hypothetical protein